MCLGNGCVSLIAGKQQKEKGKERQQKFEDFEEDAKEDGRMCQSLSSPSSKNEKGIEIRAKIIAFPKSFFKFFSKFQ